MFQALSGGDCKTVPLLAALFQKYKPAPFTPALDATDAVGTIVPHCELFVAIGALGNGLTVMVLGVETSVQVWEIIVAV